MKKFIPPFFLVMLCINLILISSNTYSNQNKQIGRFANVVLNSYSTENEGFNKSLIYETKLIEVSYNNDDTIFTSDTILCKGSPAFVWNGQDILTDKDSSYMTTYQGTSGEDSILMLNVAVNACLTCQDIVPYYGVDLNGSPDSTWILEGKDVVKRAGLCCHYGNGISDEQCISFNVHLDENSIGLKFNVSDPAPVGIEYYSINCGPLIPIGDIVCLAGGKAYALTFCMVGEDRPDYIIESIAGALLSDTLTVKNDNGAVENFHVEGLDPETINWSVTYPLNSEHLIDNLDLSDPENPVFSPGAYVPPKITYSVCGTLKDVKCDSLNVMDCASIDITILPGNKSLYTVLDTTYREGSEPFIWNDLIILTDADSSYSKIFTSSLGYDSIVILNTVVIPSTLSRYLVTIDEEELPYVWNGIEYNEPGTYNITLTNSMGRDSLVTLILEVYTTIYMDTVFCVQDIPAVWNDVYIDREGGIVLYDILDNGEFVAYHVNVIIVPEIAPVFEQISPLCQNEEALVLPTVSLNGITGEWSQPEIATEYYGTIKVTFTPNPGQCASDTTMDIKIFEHVRPVFNPIGPLCQYSKPPTLPLTDLNGIKGTWSLDHIYTDVPGTYLYLFTPEPSYLCSVPDTIEVVVMPSVISEISEMDTLSQFSIPPVLPATDLIGIKGTWNPSTISTDAVGTFEYIFTPDQLYLCFDSDTIRIIVVNVTKSETHQQKELNCNVFPNPSDGNLNIGFSGNINSDIKVDAIDVSGRLVKSFLMENYPGISKLALDLQDFESGVYYLNIIVNEERITKEVIIE